MARKPLNRIIQGDCLEVMKDWPDNCVDLVCTDPPYNLGKNYGLEHDDKLPEDIYWQWFKEVFKEIYRVSSIGYFYISHSDKGIYKAKPILEEIGLKYIQTLIWWGKNGYSMQLHRRSWSYRHEPVLFMCKGEPEVLSSGEAGDWYTSVFDVPRPQSNFKEGRQHPTQKPILLYFRFLKRTPGDIVFDPFCGSGSTCLAAKLLGKKFIGIDISEEYCEVSRTKLKGVESGLYYAEQKAGQMALFKE